MGGLGELGGSGPLEPSRSCGDGVSDGGTWLVGPIRNVIQRTIIIVAPTSQNQYLASEINISVTV